MPPTYRIQHSRAKRQRRFRPPRGRLFGCTLLPENLPDDEAMSSEGTSRAPMMPLRELVDRYLSVAGSFGIPSALFSFALSHPLTQRLFPYSAYDYYLSSLCP